MTILITGANGQLGQCFRHLAAQYRQWDFIFNDFPELDITSHKAVSGFFESRKSENKIHWCINCAAYTAVDKAESEPVKARKINVAGPKNLAEACAANGATMVQLSTDYVYHNRQNTPFQENDPVSPKSVYARTKLAGDRAVLKANAGAMVVRTSWVYSELGHNFVKTMLRRRAWPLPRSPKRLVPTSSHQPAPWTGIACAPWCLLSQQRARAWSTSFIPWWPKKPIGKPKRPHLPVRVAWCLTCRCWSNLNAGAKKSTKFWWWTAWKPPKSLG